MPPTGSEQDVSARPGEPACVVRTVLLRNFVLGLEEDFRERFLRIRITSLDSNENDGDDSGTVLLSSTVRALANAEWRIGEGALPTRGFRLQVEQVCTTEVEENEETAFLTLDSNLSLSRASRLWEKHALRDAAPARVLASFDVTGLARFSSLSCANDLESTRVLPKNVVLFAGASGDSGLYSTPEILARVEKARPIEDAPLASAWSSRSSGKPGLVFQDLLEGYGQERCETLVALAERVRELEEENRVLEASAAAAMRETASTDELLSKFRRSRALHEQGEASAWDRARLLELRGTLRSKELVVEERLRRLQHSLHPHRVWDETREAEEGREEDEEVVSLYRLPPVPRRLYFRTDAESFLEYRRWKRAVSAKSLKLAACVLKSFALRESPLSVGGSLLEFAPEEVSGEFSEEKAGALGNFAHLVLLLSSFFNVPLRYPILALSSRSVLFDPLVLTHCMQTGQHPHHASLAASFTWNARNELVMHRPFQASTVAASHLIPGVYPLFLLGVERAARWKFDRGVLLLLANVCAFIPAAARGLALPEPQLLGPSTQTLHELHLLMSLHETTLGGSKATRQRLKRLAVEVVDELCRFLRGLRVA